MGADATLMKLRRAPIVKMAAAAFQEFGEDRQGAYVAVNAAKSVGDANAIVKTLRKAAATKALAARNAALKAKIAKAARDKAAAAKALAARNAALKAKIAKAAAKAASTKAVAVGSACK